MSEVILKTDFKPYLERHTKIVDIMINQWVFRFANDKGVSVVSNRYIDSNEIITYGNQEKPFEVCEVHFYDETEKFELVNEPFGYLDEDKVNGFLHTIERK